jgi:hypothetical protein
MVNPNSKTFQISEKIGQMVGRSLRYLVLGGMVLLLSRLLKGSKPVQPAPPTV